MSDPNSRFPGPTPLDIENDEKAGSSDDRDTGHTSADSANEPTTLRSQDESADADLPQDSSKENGEEQGQMESSGGSPQMSWTTNVLITIALCVSFFPGHFSSAQGQKKKLLNSRLLCE